MAEVKKAKTWDELLKLQQPSTQIIFMKTTVRPITPIRSKRFRNMFTLA